MNFSDKKGLELAAGTIVLLIVGIVILSLSLTLTYQIFCGAEDYVLQLDSQSERELERLLAGGGRVQVAINSKLPDNQASVLCGSSGTETARFMLGIKNLNTGETTFTVDVERTIPTSDIDDEVQFFDSVTVGGSSTGGTPILITVPPSRETEFVYKVTVSQGTDVVGIQNLYVQPSN